MKAVVFHGVGDIRIDEVPEPELQAPTDAIVRLTSSAICGTDLHFVRGTMSGMRPGTILGHEGVGVIEELGEEVRNFEVGERVVINFNREAPVEAIRRLTDGIGVDRVIDAVGVDAERPKSGPAAEDAGELTDVFEREVAQNAPETAPQNGNWKPGDAPSQALRWAVEGLAKAGTLSIIGVYPPTMEAFPIGIARNKNITMNMGNCNHRKYLPRLVELVGTGAVVPSAVISQVENIEDAVDAYRSFDKRETGWMKVELAPAA